MKQVMTVQGPISPDQLGLTLMHEHLFIDIRCWLAKPQNARQVAVADQPVTLVNLGVIRREPMISSDNLMLDDFSLAVDELTAYRQSGGRTLVELTQTGIGRDPARMKKVANATGVHVVCGCGYYVAASHPPQVAGMSVREIAAEMVRDLSFGIGETGVRAGIIGEIGMSPGIHPDEAKVLRAAAWAAKETGAAITIHTPWPRGDKLRILNLLAQEGADLTRVIMGHLEYEWDADLHQALADRGAYLEYDCFGQEYYRDTYQMHDPLDTERIAMVAEMIRRGYLEQILLSQDVANKTDTQRYGGWGYVHLTEHIEPMMQAAGIAPEQIHTMRVENPRRILPF